MSNTRAAALIAARLPSGLRHPGDGNAMPPKVIPLPGLANTGIPQEMADHFAAEAGFPSSDVPKLIAEAVVDLLETDGGFEIVERTELEQLRAAAAGLDQVDPTLPVVDVFCRCNPSEPIVRIALGRKMILTNGALLRQRLDSVCTCPTSG